MDRIISNLRNKCEGHGLINRPPTSPYLHDCWWRNEPPTTLKEAKPKQEDVSSEAPPPAKSDITLFADCRVHYFTSTELCNSFAYF